MNNGATISGLTAYRIIAGGVFAIAAYLAVDKLTSIEASVDAAVAQSVKTNKQLTAVDSLAKANQLINEMQGKMLDDHEGRIRVQEAVRFRGLPP